MSWGSWGLPDPPRTPPRPPRPPPSETDDDGTDGTFNTPEPEPHHPSSSSGTLRTTEQMAQVLPSRQQPQTEEGATQAQEQAPEMQRTVVQQGSPRGEPETYPLSPEKTGLINVGREDEPVYVRKNRRSDEEIQTSAKRTHQHLMVKS